mmetsp:Transcript_67136/g.139285  ORF Transcript_67136/g.139285 Transcript_67136/m.139285 type:complete len:286 (-) Transcript_67136:1184-2041(-)
MTLARPVSVERTKAQNLKSCPDALLLATNPVRDFRRGSSFDHVAGMDLCNLHGRFHRIPAERLPELLVQNHLNQGRLVALHLTLDGGGQGLLELLHTLGFDALQAAGSRHLGILHTYVEFGSDEVVFIPQGRVSLLGAPLVIPEDHHGHTRPITSSARSQLVDGDAESTIARKANHRDSGVSDLRSKDGREAISARTEEPRRQVLSRRWERRIGVADSAIVADVRRHDGLFRHHPHDGAPCLPWRQATGVRFPRPLVPSGALIIQLVVHAFQLGCPGFLLLLHQL